MTPAQRDYIDALAEKLSEVSELTMRNAETVSSLVSSVEALKEACGRTWECVGELRTVHADDQNRVWAEIRSIRKDMQAAIDAIRGEIATAKYVAGGLAVVGGVIGVIIGRVI